ncbi:MAG: 1-acyl-sn-glycerol-3-phosphate acyltransferase [Kangiella sp.]|nr:MAG: 1-acyl-sn-glycerol-3-phosphate acyltransferase [Kangiella sp.]
MKLQNKNKVKKRKSAGKVRIGLIAFLTGLYTFISSMKIILGSLVVKNNRKLIDKIMLQWAKNILGTIHLTLKVSGQENLQVEKNAAVIVMCNHSSLYDIPVAIQALNTSFRFVAKKEMFNIPVLGTAIKYAEFISIDRKNHEQAIKDLEKAKEKMLDGITLWMAPEGTRSKDGKLAKFKKGGFHIALDTNATIIPIVIKDIHKVQAGDQMKIFLGQTIDVEICKPIDSKNYSHDSRLQLIEDVRNSMLSVLNRKLKN